MHIAYYRMKYSVGGLSNSLSSQVFPCNLGPCPTHCQWGHWTSWTACSIKQSRKRRDLGIRYVEVLLSTLSLSKGSFILQGPFSSITLLSLLSLITVKPDYFYRSKRVRRDKGVGHAPLGPQQFFSLGQQETILIILFLIDV